MAQPVKQSHSRPQLVAAEDGVFRRLHVEDAITGVPVGLPADATFDNVVINNSLAIGGPTTSTGNISTSLDIFCRNLTASAAIASASLGTTTLGATTATVTNASITNVTNTPSFAAGATIAAGQTLTVNDATIAGTGASSISVAGNIASTAGSVTAQTNLVATTGTVTAAGNITSTAGAVTAQTNLVATTGSVTAAGNITSTAGALSALSGSVTGDMQAATFNTFPHPLPRAGGPTVDVVNGLVFPVLTIPAGGSGMYRVTNASLAGMANNQPNPGAGLGGIGGDGLATITSIGGDLTNRSEVWVFNNSQHALVVDMPNNSSRGWIWWPGTILRVSRSGVGGGVWTIQPEPLYWQSRMLADLAVISPNVTTTADVTMSRAEISYALRATCDVLANDVLCEFHGNVGFLLDRSAVPAADPVVVDVRLPIGWAASAAWNALPEDGFIPSFGNLDFLEYYPSPVNGASPTSGVVGVGSVKEDPLAIVRVALDETPGNGFLRVTASNLGATGNALTIYAPFRILADRYTYAATL